MKNLLPVIGRALVLATAGVVLLPAAPAVAAPDDTSVTITGHGWGHGRGLGQYGALGYAVDRSVGWEDILRRYYGGNRVARDAPDDVWTVRLEGWRQRPMLAVSRPGSLVVRSQGAPVLAGATAVQVARVGVNSFQVLTAPGCGGPWTPNGGAVPGPVLVGGQHEGTPADMVGLCEANQSRAYRGQLVAVDDAGFQDTVNHVKVESYLRGVVPRESPASWGDLGGGKGMNALRAQAVAARSYALGERRAPYARTCDTTSCQVYLGAAERPYSGAARLLEDSRTDRAIADTVGGVMRSNRDGSIARTEFSSSTGGYTAGGTFPAVLDEGDSTPSNPNRNWSKVLSEGDVAARLGVPDIRSIQVTQRNGLGAEGGRVLTVVVDTGSQQVSFTGNQFRSRLELKSDWFSVAPLPASSPADRKFAEALYLDFLGRPGETQGIDHWATLVSSGRMTRSEVALYMARSEEWVGRMVDGLYADTLGRAPDADGRRFWIDRIRGGSGPADVAAEFYASQEYWLRTGSDDRLWVDDLYRKLLDRSADSDGRAFWVSQSASRGRVFVATAFYQSLESRYTRVEALYQLLLGRSVDAAGKKTWPDVILQQGDLALASFLAGSQEYYQRAQER